MDSRRPHHLTLWAGLQRSVATFTVIPVGRLRSEASAHAAALWAPVAVLPLAVVAAGLAWIGGWLDAAPLAAVAVVAWGAWSTRAMHLDAIADVADALGGGWTPERAREILHRGDVGPMGVVTLVLVLAAQAVATWQLTTDGRWLLVGVAVVAARCAVVLPCRRGHAAMPGSRLGRDLAGTIGAPVAVLWLVLGTALVCVGALLTGAGAILASGVALITWGVVGRLVSTTDQRFGGVNGDVMGASVESAQTALLVGLALIG